MVCLAYFYTSSPPYWHPISPKLSTIRSEQANFLPPSNPHMSPLCLRVVTQPHLQTTAQFSLLPIISRIMEAFVKKQLTAYLESAQLLPTSQFAYRKQHSTEDALVLAVNRWSLAPSRQEYTGVVFVDMSKAFDRVPHERLLTELFSLGISGTPLTSFADYLPGRFQQIRVKGHLSPAVSCSHRTAFLVPCYLSCTLAH